MHVSCYVVGTAQYIIHVHNHQLPGFLTHAALILARSSAGDDIGAFSY